MLKRMSYRFTHGSMVVVLALTLSAYVSVSDVETAIIEKDYAQAREKAEALIKENPSQEKLNQIRYYLGVSQLGLNQYALARKSFKLVMKNHPDDRLYDQAWLGIIDSYGMEEKFELSLSESEKFLKQRPQSEFLSIIYLKIGRANLKLSHWDTARIALNKLVRDYPESFEAHTAGQLLEERRLFTIQVGAFLDQSRALVLLEELQAKRAVRLYFTNYR